MSPAGRARLDVTLAALLFSTGGVAIKTCTLNSWQIACWRSAIAALTVLVLRPSLVRSLSRRVWLVGVAFGGTMVLYALANKATTAANAIILQDSAPLYVLLLAPWLLGERNRRSDLVVMLVMAAGLLLVVFGGQAASATAPFPMRGNLMGAGAGLCWALTVIGLRGLVANEATGQGGAFAAVFTGNVFACLVTLPQAFASSGTGGADDVALQDVGIVVFLGVVQIALAYVFLNRGMAGVSALDASLILLVEPVFATLWAALVFGEQLGGWALVGAGGILLATIGKGWIDSQLEVPHAHHRPVT